MTTLEPGPSDVELDGVTRTLRNMTIGGHPLTIFHGGSEGKRSERNDPLLFRDHAGRCLAYVEAGGYCLPLVVRAKDRKWVTTTDRVIGHRSEMPMDSIGAHPGNYHLFSLLSLVAVNRITGERDGILASEVTATD